VLGWLLAQADSPQDLLRYVRDGGILGILIVIVVGSMRKWWVPGWLYKQAIEEGQARLEHQIEQTKERLDEAADREEEWKRLALSGTALAERQLTVLEAAAQRPVRQPARRRKS